MNSKQREINIPPLPDEALHAGSILFCGGTFDPVHRAHVELPVMARDRLGCDYLLYVPTSISPFKRDTQAAPPADRLAMLKLAMEKQPRTGIWTYEINNPGIHYTVDTLTVLHSLINDNVTVYLLMGADQAKSLHRWKEAGRLVTLCRPVFMLRPPDTGETVKEALKKYWPGNTAEKLADSIVELPLVDISATSVREKLARGENVNDMLHARVYEYIKLHGLYGSGTDN